MNKVKFRIIEGTPERKWSENGKYCYSPAIWNKVEAVSFEIPFFFRIGNDIKFKDVFTQIEKCYYDADNTYMVYIGRDVYVDKEGKQCSELQ
jgi:hypothetical protein